MSRCCSLYCSRCPCSFCAWCLQDCGADAHAHVANCRLNMAPGRDVFASEDAWRRGRTNSKREAVTAYLAGLDGGLAGRVAAAVAQDLRDVQLGDVVDRFAR